MIVEKTNNLICKSIKKHKKTKKIILVQHQLQINHLN